MSNMQQQQHKHKQNTITTNQRVLNIMSSIKAYGKVDETDQARLEARQKNRKRITIISLSAIVLVAIVVAAVVGTSANHSGGNGGGSDNQSLSAVCDVTLYKDSCYSSLASVAKPDQLQPEELFKLSVKVAMDELSKASTPFSNDGGIFVRASSTDNMTIEALNNCQELLSLAMEHLNSSYAYGDHSTSLLDVVDDIRSWLSAAGTCHQTCIDGLLDATTLKTNVQDLLRNSTELTSNSLAIVTWIYKAASSVKMRRLMSYDDDNNKHKMPEWLHLKDRKLLQSSGNLKKKADAVVAKDGTGKYKTIGAAIKAVPDKSNKRFVIYVKKGVYLENVRVEKKKWNVMMIGDGMNETIVSAGLNFVDGTPTFSTATFAVFGKGFIARDMGFRNTAGPAKHQAVALMASADQSVFYRCTMDAYQDTLYAHANRQFYRECNIYGTVDFIFGNSAVVLQNCNILPKRPMRGQQNTITAQGKVDPNQNTGICIHNCTIWPFGNLTGVQTFLGRPWKNYSTTVYMRSMMASFIDPSGWLPWTGNTAPPTIFYSEYQNFGRGSSTKNRVKWKGLRAISYKQASKFTVKAFLHGDKWIPDSGASFNSGL